jgi:hypothetical protein
MLGTGDQDGQADQQNADGWLLTVVAAVRLS